MREEVGIDVAAVAIVGSQAWPLGRAGSCEIMIGCIAKAVGDEIVLDNDEVCKPTLELYSFACAHPVIVEEPLLQLISQLIACHDYAAEVAHEPFLDILKTSTFVRAVCLVATRAWLPQRKA